MNMILAKSAHCSFVSFLFRWLGGYTRLQGGRWSDSRALSCVERFDTFNQYWTTVSSLHQARSGLGVAVLEGMIYVVGGNSSSVVCLNLQTICCNGLCLCVHVYMRVHAHIFCLFQ